ncbi:hypothetical protein KC19_11G090500 [Ceratodon purpureus]|uniref:Uncharacterized protein n=1 Tax=Ceratodon purpureus TaxID=3225 RepID=A0A8T0GF64_CERPU|nr:hypothetical protein KC19_11G090500 [Ceratodon purpureus]
MEKEKKIPIQRRPKSHLSLSPTLGSSFTSSASLLIHVVVVLVLQKPRHRQGFCKSLLAGLQPGLPRFKLRRSMWLYSSLCSSSSYSCQPSPCVTFELELELDDDDAAVAIEAAR